MKAEEKQLIYTLLKTADAYECGFTREKFAGEPAFTDDTENTVVESVETTAEHREEGRDVAFVLSERDDCSGNLRATVATAQEVGPIKRAAIAVGSEGGISPDEVKYLEEKGLFVPIHFAVNILRCETAALYGIAAVQTEINNRLSGQAGQ